MSEAQADPLLDALIGDFGGNYTFALDLRATGKHRLTMPIRTPGKASKAYRAGANLTLDGATIGSRTWEDFLAEQISARG